MLVETGSRKGCSSCLSWGLLVVRSINRLSLGRTTACALPGLISFHSYLRRSPAAVRCSSEDCTALSAPSPVLNSEVATLPFPFCWMEKVSVATRRPFWNTPKEPASTIWPADSFSLPAPAAAAETSSSQTAPTTSTVLTTSLLLILSERLAWACATGRADPSTLLRAGLLTRVAVWKSRTQARKGRLFPVLPTVFPAFRFPSAANFR